MSLGTAGTLVLGNRHGRKKTALITTATADVTIANTQIYRIDAQDITFDIQIGGVGSTTVLIYGANSDAYPNNSNFLDISSGGSTASTHLTYTGRAAYFGVVVTGSSGEVTVAVYASWYDGN